MGAALALLCLLRPSTAQSKRVRPTVTDVPPWQDWRYKKHSVYGEFAGPALLLSFNYERILRSVALRAGAGLGPGGGDKAIQLTLPLTVSYLSSLFVKRNNFRWEIGLGPVLAWNSASDKHILAYGPGLGIAGTAILGFRLLFKGSGMLRLAYAPILGLHGFMPLWGGLALGGTFGGPSEPDQCHAVDTCANGKCSYKPRPDDTRCDDGNLCTSQDRCRAGICSGQPVTCGGESECRYAAKCDPSRGCWSSPKPDGLACTDTNACTHDDACRAGVCLGDPVTCAAGDQCHDAGRCDPASGCSAPQARPDGTACNDAHPCTLTDTCQQGQCTGADPTSNSEACLSDLAQRFRPYLKFSVDQGDPEPHRPSSWRRLYERSYIQIHRDGWSKATDDAMQTLRFANVGEKDGCTDDVRLKFDAGADLSGEPWEAVAGSGHGIYAHVNQFRGGKYLVEYWMLYPYNRINGDCGADCGWWQWFTNTDHCVLVELCEKVLGELNHEYDLTNMAVVYDALENRVERVTFSQHGCTLQEFGIPSSSQGRTEINFLRDRGIPDNGINGGPVSTDVQEIAPVYTSMLDECDPMYGFVAPPQVLYMVKDPETGRYDHPVVFVEWGTHENWPNRGGRFLLVPGHGGDGPSFLPDTVPLLSPDSKPDQPFVLFGGKYGDPAGIMRHRGWYHNAGEIYLPCSFVDHPDPYARPPFSRFLVGGRSPSVLTTGLLTVTGTTTASTSSLSPAEVKSLNVWIEASRAAVSAPAAAATCERAFADVSTFAGVIQKRAIEGRLSYAVPKAPDHRQFLATCTRLSAAAQRCLTITYARSHQDECVGLRKQLTPETAEQLRALVK